jgi:hypothetical protein
MAKGDIAAQWLAANKAERIANWPHKRRTVKVKPSPYVENRVAYEAPDQVALARLGVEHGKGRDPHNRGAGRQSAPPTSARALASPTTSACSTRTVRLDASPP